jgi:hypothetical protein
MRLAPELEELYTRWLRTIPRGCSPHFYNLSHQHQIVVLMEKPLKLEQPPERSPVLPYIQACRGRLLDWLTRRRKIWTQIACALPPSLAEAKLTDVDDLIGNVYFTDCVKCQTKDNDPKDDVRYHEPHTARCLPEEFALLRNAALFITLSARAWETVRGLLPPLSPVDWDYQHLVEPPRADSDLMPVHGVLFEDEASAAPGRGTFVIPLTFPGGRPALRDSYLVYAKEGLAALTAKLHS